MLHPSALLQMHTKYPVFTSSSLVTVAITLLIPKLGTLRWMELGLLSCFPSSRPDAY